MTRALSVSPIPPANDDEPLHSLDRDIALELASSAVAWCEGLLADRRTEAQAGEDGEDETDRRRAGR